MSDRELYKWSYRWIRMYIKKATYLNRNIVDVNTEHRQHVFGSALASYQCRDVPFEGWLNVWRQSKFENIHPYSRYNLDIPF